MRKLLHPPNYTHAPVHDYILKKLFALSVQERKWVEGDDSEPNPDDWYNSLSEDKSTIFVDTWWWSLPEGDYRYCNCCLGVNDIQKAFDISGDYCNDDYGTIDTKIGGVLLNSYGLEPFEDYENEDGFCHIAAFATVSDTGVVRYSQIVYDLPKKCLVLREDVCYNMYMNSVKLKLFGMKRACYRNEGESLTVAYDFKYIHFLDNRDGFAAGFNPKNDPLKEVITI